MQTHNSPRSLRTRIVLAGLLVLPAFFAGLAFAGTPHWLPGPGRSGRALLAQEVETRLVGPICEWRIQADGTVFLRMRVEEPDNKLAGDRWLRTPSSKSDATRFENLVIESVLQTAKDGDMKKERFYAHVEVEAAREGRDIQSAIKIQALGRDMD